MEVHIIIDHGRSGQKFLRTYSNMEKLFNDYLDDMKKYYLDHYTETITKFKNLENPDESETEILRAFENKPYDAELIDLEKYFDEYDCDCQYYLRYI